MTTRQRLATLERIGRRAQAPEEPPATWRGVAALWRELLEAIGNVDPTLAARVDRIGARPGPAPGEAPATEALLVLSCAEACGVASEIIGVVSCG